MSKQTLKSIAQRGMTLGAAFAVVAASLAQAVPAYADALNPLTERSLTLSSSSPGWSYTDGSGNTTYAPPNSGANGQKTGNYFSFKTSTAATVNTFSFQYCTTPAGNCTVPGDNTVNSTTNTASTSDLHIEYPSATEISATSADRTGTITVTDGSATVTGSGTAFRTELRKGSVIRTAGGNDYKVDSIASNTSLTLTANATADESGVTFKTPDFLQVIDPATGAVKGVPGYTNSSPKYVAQGGYGDEAEVAKSVTGSFVVIYKSGGQWLQSAGWSAASHTVANARTATKNYITLTNATGQAFTVDQEVKVLFFANATNYITNPGSSWFFVKINTYNKEFNLSPTGGQVGLSGLAPVTDANIIDGGVTVANVMNQSIQITTKVLETMEFSVGTVDPNTLTAAELAASDNPAQIPCGRILTALTAADTDRNVLRLGDQNSESSLTTQKAYATHSYWRLSSNSSGGATVYYSGHTLANTSGDEIKAIGDTPAVSAPGSEQFGLAMATTALSGAVSGSNAATPNFNTGTYGVNYVQDRAGGSEWENGADNGKTSISAAQLLAVGATHTGTPTTWSATDADWDYAALNLSYHTPRLDPLAPINGYGNGSGRINGNDSLDRNGVAFGGGGYDTTNAQFAFDTMSDTVPRAIATETSQVVDCVSAKMRYVANIAATTPAGIYTTKINYIAAPQY